VILLARHGETPDNASGRIQGHRDPPLSEHGREQALALAEQAAAQGARAVWVSHLRRARETAAIVGARLGVEPVVDPRLAEAWMGEWEGRFKEELQSEQAEEWAAYGRGGAFRFPGGESLPELRDRVLAALDDVRAGPAPALVVCHGGAIRAAFASASPRGLDAFHELGDVANGDVLVLPEPVGASPVG
jgi:broad specificity phosphatase PhoE